MCVCVFFCLVYPILACVFFFFLFDVQKENFKDERQLQAGLGEIVVFAMG